MNTVTDQFVHLHVHDEYSMLDGASGTAKLVAEAVRLEQPAVAQTNHGNMMGSFRFHKECKSQGIKPIIGMEAYCAPSHRQARGKETWGTNDEGREIPSGGSAYTHLTLLAATGEGVKNLYELTSRSYAEGFYQKPRIDLDLLEALSRGLIIGSGCLSGELLARLQLGQIDQAESYVRMMKERFGDAFFIEVMDHGFTRESQYIPTLVELANRSNIRLVATNDSHYTKAEDFLLHDAMLCMGTHTRFDDPKRMRFDGSGYFLKSRLQMEELGLPKEALDNTLYIADQVEDYGEIFSHRLLMPSSGIFEPHEHLVKVCWAEAERRGFDDRYDERLTYELDIIERTGFSDYFVVLEDIIRFARSEGIGIGVGRGSAAGSLVTYLLGITGVDPIEHGLLFERFLNPERVSLPDIDMDFENGRRDEVLKYAMVKYGAENCARIFAEGTFGAKKALAGSARILGRPFGTGTSLARALPRAEFGKEPTLSMADMSLVDDQEVWDLAVAMEGLVSSPGMHAGGFVISPVPISTVIPTFISERKSDIRSTQWDMHAVEELGLVKFDFLGLKTLDVMQDALRLSNSRLPEGLDDRTTYELLSRGDTVGCFQLSGSSMRALLRRVAPRNFAQLAAVLALYRPGPMGVGAHNQFADRLNGREAISYPHPEFEEALRDILDPTYGVICYQEQVMQTLQRVCGYSLAQADLVRKAMGKKDRALLNSEFGRFREGGLANGYSEGALQTLWDVLVPFADYAFGKGHATAYAYNAYWTAYLKAHQPWSFMSALLTHSSTAKRPGKQSSQAEDYVAEVARMGIPVLPPSVNGLATWSPGENGIRYGITSIKGVGEKVAPPLLRAAPYSSWTDYLTRAPKSALNMGVVKALIMSGAMDSFGPRESLLDLSEEHVANALLRRKDLSKGARGFGVHRYDLPDVQPDWTSRRRRELATLGVGLSYPAVTVNVREPLDEGGWEFLFRVIDRSRGQSPVTVSHGSWSMRLATAVDSERITKDLTPLGVDVVM